MRGLSRDTSFTSAVLFGAPCCSKPARCYHMPSLNTMYDHGALFLVCLPKRPSHEDRLHDHTHEQHGAVLGQLGARVYLRMDGSSWTWGAGTRRVRRGMGRDKISQGRGGELVKGKGRPRVWCSGHGWPVLGGMWRRGAPGRKKPPAGQRPPEGVTADAPPGDDPYGALSSEAAYPLPSSSCKGCCHTDHPARKPEGFTPIASLYRGLAG
jgi:hypothetical protein